MFMDSNDVYASEGEEQQGVFSVVLKYKGQGSISSLIEEADYTLNHLLIADTQVSDVCDIDNKVSVSLYMEHDVTEEEARAISEELDYSFSDEDGNAMEMEMIDIDFS